MYAFGIAFCQLTKDSSVGGRHFSSVLDSMYTLGIYGTLLDNIKYLVDELGKENLLFSALFVIYVLLTAFTVMNMLIGVLCEVVSAVAATEREEILVAYVKSKVLKVVEEIDQDGDRHITKAEMVGILENASACRALKEVGVDVMSLVDNADAIFVDMKGKELEQLSFADFMNVVLSLRGSNSATVKDMVELRRSLRAMHEAMHNDLMNKFQPMLRQLQKALHEVKPLHRANSADARLGNPESTVPSGKLARSITSPLLHDVPPVAGLEAAKGPAPPAAERLDLEGSWCALGDAKGPEVPEWMHPKVAGGCSRKQMRHTFFGGKPTHVAISANAPVMPPSSKLVPAPDQGCWCELPEAVPEEPFEIPERPPPEREPMRLLANSPDRSAPQAPEEQLSHKEASWHQLPPLASHPAPELTGVVSSVLEVSSQRPEFPSFEAPEVPDRRPAFVVSSPCKCPEGLEGQVYRPTFPIICRGGAEPGCEDTSEATCTPGSADDSRCGHSGSRLPPLSAETGGWCPVGAAELRGQMVELTKNLTAGLCQVKRLEERLRQPARSPATNVPASLPPIRGMEVAKTTPVELE
mmetsp:Transcript_45340/g.140233  ORF Transcript_45340/g.140233 Transcript_45340/m.140233 type:complete len:582 (-) Transcript_45340:45-1790(-)